MLNKDQPMQDVLIINDEETLEMLAVPRRLHILRAIAQAPLTAPQIATTLDISLEDIEFDLRVLTVYELIVAHEDGTYHARARRYIVDEPASNEAPLTLALQILEQSKDEIIQQRHILFDPAQHEYRAEFGKGLLHLTRSEARELAEELNAIWERFADREPGPGTAPYTLLMLFFEIDS